MIAINSDILREIHRRLRGKIDIIIAKKKNNLIQLYDNPFKTKNKREQESLTPAEYLYLGLLIQNFESIVLADPNEIQVFEQKFSRIISGVRMSKHHQLFKNELVVRMGYTELRNEFYPEYFEEIGIKTCVYCNSQLALTVRKVDGTKSAKFQVDHFLAKSEYPCFSISFYNLYPVCGPCNGSKSSNYVDFTLYSNDYKDYSNSSFKFRIDSKSLLKYRVNGIQSKLEVKFEDHGAGVNETFAIEGIYNAQKDLAEELVLKSMIYNKTYSESLKSSLERLYREKAPLVDRLLIGNYTKDRDIHKRPMAKFTMDIARQLNLIK